MREESKGEVQAIRDGILFQAGQCIPRHPQIPGWTPARPTVPRTNALPVELHSIRLEFQSKQNGLQFIPRKTEFILPLSLEELPVFGAGKSQGSLCFNGFIEV